MSTSFTNNPTINEIIANIPEGKRYSDVEDADGNQYVDLVQEGGGTLGIALVGYTYVLEKAGIRFFSLAGTSAGAINTVMMAGLAEIKEPKSEKILDILSKKDLFDFVDGHPAIRKIINKIIKKEKGLVFSLIWNIRRIYKAITKRLGLNPGNDFEKWITKELEDSNIKTLSDLVNLRKKLPRGLKNVQTGEEITNMSAKFAIIASDITTHTKTEFPRMAGLYWKDVNIVPPAKMVRASMSIPFFFEPFQVDNIPNYDSNAVEGKGDEEIHNQAWYDLARYKGPVPPKVSFVDGGMLSNFPIDVFHRPDGGVPRMPTFGARLSAYRNTYSKADNIGGISLAMVSTMRQIHDYDFLLKNPDFSKLICRIDANVTFNWLDFNMTEQEQVNLFNLGAKKALEFLQDFDWEGYKKIREKK